MPGITGMSQINFTGKKRNLLKKVELDMIFVDNYTLANYFKILFKTPLILLRDFLKIRLQSLSR